MGLLASEISVVQEQVCRILLVDCGDLGRIWSDKICLMIIYNSMEVQWCDCFTSTCKWLFDTLAEHTDVAVCLVKLRSNLLKAFLFV